MKKHLTAITLGAAITLSGCSTFLGGELIREGEPTGTIRVINSSSNVITAVTVSQCNAMSHGLNRLSSGDSISPGDSRMFTASNGCYDVMAGYGWGTGYATGNKRMTLRAGQTTSITFQDGD